MQSKYLTKYDLFCILYIRTFVLLLAGGDGMVCLSRADIEKISNKIIEAYKAACVPEKRLCYQVDAMKLAQLLGLTVDFQSLSQDCSILGLTTPIEACITILDDKGEPVMYCLDGSTMQNMKARPQPPQHITITAGPSIRICPERPHSLALLTAPMIRCLPLCPMPFMPRW